MMELEKYSLPQSTRTAFERAIENGTFPHASILLGNSEEKLLKIANELASALVCGRENAPCGECADCIKSRKHVHPDIKVVSPQQKRKSVNMEECRDMIMDSFILPNEAERKVYIITSAHTLDERVQNSLLKTLEEPPHYAYFILLCMNSSAMLGTVMSRVSAFTVGEGEEGDAAGEKAQQIAEEIVSALFDINETTLIRATAPLDRDRRLVSKTMERFKEKVNVSVKAKQGIGTDETGMASRFTLKELMNLNSVADEIITAADRNANEKLLITLISAKLRHAIGG